jgi:thioredoxin 2
MCFGSKEPAMAELHIVCPHCAATNRLPAGKNASAGKCGACHAALFDGHPAPVDAGTFDKHRRNNDIAVLVDVWAPWCGPCRTMAPMFEAAAAELEPQVRLIKLNADEAPAVAAEYEVSGIPALLLFRGGRVVARSAGVMDARRIVAWTRGHLAQAA